MGTTDEDRLVEQVSEADRNYYAGTPTVTDDEYDAMKERLRAMVELGSERAAELLGAVGSTPSSKALRVKHKYLMRSLDNCFDREQLETFCDKVGAPRYAVEPKLDGMSLELEYCKGVLVRALTRGDGRVGEDVTKNARAVGQLPLMTASTAPFVSVRGEVLFTKDAFERANERRRESGGSEYANARNAAAGTMRRKEINDDTRDLMFVAYDVEPKSTCGATGQSGLLKLFNALGFVTPPSTLCSGTQDVCYAYDQLQELREDLKFEADGVVVKVDDFALREELGESDHAPNWAIAWKFASQKTVTRVLEITHQVGRTGRITPVAELEPVPLAGVVVRCATLHNYDLLEEKDIRVGDDVVVERAGDVIPEVVGLAPGAVDVESRGPACSCPSICPRCGALVEYDGKYVCCSAGTDCVEQLVHRIVHWCSRAVADVDRLGTKLAESLVDAGLVADVADLYVLTEEQLESLPGVGRKTARKVVSQLESSKTMSLDKFLFGLSLNCVGKSTAKVLAKEFVTLEAVRALAPAEVESVPGMGTITAFNVFEALFDSRDLIDKLVIEGVVPLQFAAERPREGGLSGEVLVFTGVLPVKRSEAQSTAEAHGAVVSGSVGAKTTLVVVGDKPGSKLEKARKLGVRVVGFDEFKNMVGE